MESPLKALSQIVKLTDLNPYITCYLCNGYLVDASTITECLHTFCKSCIVKHIQISLYCPKCNTKIHETWPYYSIRLDRTMQDIVHKLLPRVEKEEGRRQGDFYRTRGIPWPPPDPKPAQVRHQTMSNIEDSLVSLVLEYIGSSSELTYTVKPLAKKFVRVTKKATVRHVQTFLTRKLDLTDKCEIDVISNDEIMEPEITLEMIERHCRKEDGLMVLYYGVGVKGGGETRVS
ncbi:polycomb group RING finger protein 6-like [Glandiceps talaboti]